MNDAVVNNDYLHLHVRAYANNLYQQDRWRILERRENCVKAASIVLGTAAFADVKGMFAANGDGNELLVLLLLSFVVLNALALVLQWGAKARDAAKRSSEWITLIRDMEEEGKAADERVLNRWRARAAEIEAGEPAANEYLRQRAFRRACDDLGAERVHEEGSLDAFLRRLPRLVHPLP